MLLVRAVADRDAVFQEEKQEKAFQLAEMEATKAGNIIEHEAEIYSRPKREWFLTNTQKKASAQAAAQQEKSAGPTAQHKTIKDAQKETHKGPKKDRKGAPALSKFKLSQK